MSDTDLSDLQAFLDQPPPPGLSAATPDAIADLVQMCERAREDQIQQISRAIDDSLRLVPRPLRGVVKRVIGA